MIFASPEAARRPQDGGWAYLGKDASKREALESRLGAAIPLGRAIHAEAERLRRPFLDLVARLGRDAADPVSWWAGTLAWKDWESSDLLLLCSYLALCLRWARSPAAQTLGPAAQTLGPAAQTLCPAGEFRPGLVVIEDPWLLELLRRLLPEAIAEGGSSLWRLRLRWALTGLARRARWLVRSAASMLRQRSRSAGRPAPEAPDGAVGIYSHLLKRCFASPGRWIDPYLPGLDAELEALGVSVRRIPYTQAAGFERALADLQPRVVPTLLLARWTDLLRFAFALAPGVPPGVELEGMPIDTLIDRERWWDHSQASRPAYLLFHACAARLFALGRWKAVVFPWENQPQERMLILAARAAGVRIVGYQHTTLPRYQPAFFLGEGEDAWAPLPEVLIASGPYPLRLLREHGYAESRLVLGGSRRYPRWAEAIASPDGAVKPDALAVVPLEAPAAEQFLAALRRAWPRGPQGWTLRVKFHPASARRASGLGFEDEPAGATLHESLERCGPVVYSGSTSGLEALRAGHPVLRFTPECLLPVDPADFLDERVIPTATGADLAERLERLREDPPELGGRERGSLSELFSPVDPAAWTRAILGK